MDSKLDLYKVAEALVTLLEQFGIVINDASVDLVPYLQTLGDKIVAYKHDISIMWIIVGAVLAIISVIIFIVGCIQDWEMFHIVVLVCGLLIAAIVIVINVYTLIACNTFPEKVILDYIDNIITTSQNSRY